MTKSKNFEVVMKYADKVISGEKVACVETIRCAKGYDQGERLDDLILKSSDNEIAYTNEFSIEIIPNWRCL